MNLPSSLANRSTPATDIALYTLPVIRRGDSKGSAKSAASLNKGEADSNGLASTSGDRGPLNAASSRSPLDSSGEKQRWDDGVVTPGYHERDPLAQSTAVGAGNGPISSQSSSSTHSRSAASRDDGGDDDDDYNPSRGGSRIRHAWNSTKRILRRHCAFIGPGIIASVGYTDPGNWVTDLAAGSQFGYKLLFIVLLSGLFGIFLQILAVRMGVVTGIDLARNTRLLLLPDDDDRLRGRVNIGRRRSTTEKRDTLRFRLARIAALWSLYLVSEAALIATELAELLGSAIALNLLFPGLPLWGGVLVTSADVMLFLFVYQPQGNFRYFEFLIAVLVLIVLACYVVLLVRVDPNWADVFHGYVPSSTLVKADALYTGVGIVGAVIMPHALYLGSHFSTINRLDRSKNKYLLDDDVSERDNDTVRQAPWHERWRRNVREQIAQRFPRVDAHLRDRRNGSVARAISPPPSSPQSPRQRAGIPTMTTSSALVAVTSRASVAGKKRPSGVGPNGIAQVTARMSVSEIKLHLPHAAWDIALSLLFFAITVNSAILIVAGAAFYYNGDQTATESPQVSDLYDAYNLLLITLGKPYAVLFAIALLAAGQSASITCTLAGQLVSEGFIKWRTNAFLRRLVTRVITVIPSIAIAIGVGRAGLDEMLVASQVALAFALPFVLVPLIAVTSMRSKMRLEEEVDQESGSVPLPPSMATLPPPVVADDAITPASPDTVIAPAASPSTVIHDFTSNWATKACAAVIYVVICVADLYTLVTTIRGD